VGGSLSESTLLPCENKDTPPITDQYSTHVIRASCRGHQTDVDLSPDPLGPIKRGLGQLYSNAFRNDPSGWFVRLFFPCDGPEMPLDRGIGRIVITVPRVLGFVLWWQCDVGNGMRIIPTPQLFVYSL
jgi:hypothetical protein